MLILGIDTSGKSGGVALADFDGSEFRLLGSAPIAGGTFSAQLVPTLASLLNKHHVRLEDIEGFAVASGPGSFTGLRIGLSAVKGLAEILHKPIVTVSLLQALATLSPQEGRLIAALDAGRSEIFYSTYKVGGVTATVEEEKLLSEPEFLDQAKRPDVALVVTSDARIQQLASENAVHAHLVERPDPAIIAQIGAQKLTRGETVSVEELDANYLRRSDAELFFKGR